MLQRPIPPEARPRAAIGPDPPAPAPPDRREPARIGAPDPGEAGRADPLGAILARQLLQRDKRGRGNAGARPAKKARLAPMNGRLEHFNAAGFAGSRTNWISAVVRPAEVPQRDKTPVAKACEASGSVLGFDGGDIIGLHLGGQNVSENVVPMFPASIAAPGSSSRTRSRPWRSHRPTSSR